MRVKPLGQYIVENERELEFRLKIAKEPTDKQLDAMELHLRKYDAYDFSTPKRTIIQKNPRDFKSIDATEVYFIDFKTKHPVSPHMLVAELVQKMGIHERFMILRNKNEPLHVEDEEDLTVKDEDQESTNKHWRAIDSNEEYKPKLTDGEYVTDSENPPTDIFAGEDFKNKWIEEELKNRFEFATQYKMGDC